MKTLITFLFIFLFQSVYASADITCSASVNGDDIKLEKTASGLIMIAIEDPHFDEYDVVIDLNTPGRIKTRLAKFVSTPLVAELKNEISKLSPEMADEVLKLAKARIIDSAAGFNPAGLASLSLVQGDDRLELICLKDKAATE